MQIELTTQVHLASRRWNGMLTQGNEVRPSDEVQLYMATAKTLPDAASEVFANSIRNIALPFKPEGGFWTATPQADGSSGWEDFAKDFRHIGRHGARFFFDVVGNPRILLIRNERDILDSMGVTEERFVKISDVIQFWTSIPQDWDAMHVPQVHDHWSCLHLWDVESTIWFRPDRHLRFVRREPMLRALRRA